MTPKIISLVVLCFWFISCANNEQEKKSDAGEILAPKLTQVWTSDTTLRTPESVLYDKQRNLLYVANVNMNPWEKDGNGFISRMDLRGKIIDLEWVGGLNGPKGMGLVDNSLFVADIDQVVEINVEDGMVINRYPVEGTPTLNDITTKDGIIYISGSDSQKIFKLENGTVSLILEGDLGRPNGLYAEKGRLLMLTSNSSLLESIDLESMDRTKLVENLGHGDGIVPAGNGTYLASSWRGELFHISADWKSTQLLDTREEEINAADIDYIVDKNLLLVPTFFDNRVVAYKLE